MQLKKSVVVGTMESCDIQIIIAPNPDGGIEIDLDSVVMAQFGDAILATVQEVLQEFCVREANISIKDRGAFDWVIRARMQAAVSLACEIRFNWRGMP